MKKRMFFTALIIAVWALGYFLLPDLVVIKNQSQAQAFQMVSVLSSIILALLIIITWLTLWRAK